MTDETVNLFYLCPRCFEAADEPTLCPRCGGERVACRPGDPDDPCRKPLLAPTGRIRSRAPVWWLHVSVGWVAPEARTGWDK